MIQKGGFAYWTHRFPKSWPDTSGKVEVHGSRVEPSAIVSVSPLGLFYLHLKCRIDRATVSHSSVSLVSTFLFDIAIPSWVLFTVQTLVHRKVPSLRKKRKGGTEMMKQFMKYVSCYCVVAVLVMGIVPRAYAGFSPSEVVVLSEVDRSSDLGKIQKLLEMKMVQERFKQLGFSEDEIQSRLGQLSD